FIPDELQIILHDLQELTTGFTAVRITVGGGQNERGQLFRKVLNMDPDSLRCVSPGQRSRLLPRRLLILRYRPAGVTLRIDKQDVAVAQLHAQNVRVGCENRQNGASVGQLRMTLYQLLSLPAFQSGQAGPFGRSKGVSREVAP